MIAFLSWLIIILLLGWIAAPLTYRIFPNLADRGFFFSKILGLLLVGFAFWLLVITGVLRNDSGGILICILLLALLSFFSLRNGGWQEWRGWLSEHKRLILSGEILFLIAFGLMVLLRAANPEIIGTEKPMEMAFINSILRSPAFPPHDPWLSGYAISYYYFGYVISAILIKLSGVVTGVGFNLSIALWFALTAVAAYGMLFSLLNHKPDESGSEPVESKQRPKVLAPLLAPLFVLVLGNLEGVLEMLHARGLFWSENGGQLTSKFWQYLNVAELTSPPIVPFSWVPERLGGIWWWRASRVLQDFDLLGNVKEIIDEFPFFSYLLSDLHPHVLAVPFVLLAVAFSLNFYFTYRSRKSPSMGLFKSIVRLFGDKTVDQEKPFLATPYFWVGSLIFGGLSFLNTWDFPIYVALFCAVFILVKVQADGWRRNYIIEFIETGLSLGLAGALLYLPFYIGFASQAGGLLPSLAFFTRGIYFWLMFGIMLVPIFIWLFRSGRLHASLSDWFFGLKVSAALLFGLWLVSYGLSLLMGSLVAWATLTASNAGGQGLALGLANRIVDLNNLFAGLQGSGLGPSLLTASLIQRLVAPGTWITLLVLLTAIFAILKGIIGKRMDVGGEQPTLSQGEEIEARRERSATPFVLILLLVGAGLTLLPEFFYLRDQFGWRMNTIFKFYYQTWILWSIAGAYALVRIWRGPSSVGIWIGRLACLGLIIGGLAYPVFGILDRTNNLRPDDFTLDGNAWLTGYGPGEVKAIEFLRNAPLGVVSEAIGGSYSNFARVSTHSGQPTVLGWPGHESQWRGGSEEIGSRQSDIERLYRTVDWGEAEAILSQYQIRYVYVGSMELGEYHVNENKFAANLPVAFKNDEVTIYEVPDNTD